MSFACTVFVTSATGSQGSALCRQLRDLGWSVRATTRDTSSAAAKDLDAIGVQLITGDWDDEDALSAGLSGCDKLFLCLLPNLSDLDQAPRRADKILSVAKKCGVRHVVVSTSLGSAMLDEDGAEPPEPPTDFFRRHLESKRRIEQAVMSGGFDWWTVLRPAFFMANFLEPKIQFGYTETRDNGSWTSCMTPSSKLGLVDHVDIARFASAAFQFPSRFHGRRLGLAGDEMLVQAALDQLSAAVGDGRAIRAKFMSDDEIAELQSQGSWLFFCAEPSVRYMSNYVDMKALSHLVPGLTSFSQFLERERTAVRETYGVEESCQSASEMPDL